MQEIISKQREYFLLGETKNISFRKQQLLKLRQAILDNYQNIVDAFKKDYNKCEFDVVTTEVYMVLKEINFMLKNIKKFSRPKKIKTSLINFKSKGRIFAEPFGVCLIVAPWNYPLHLSLLPIVDAIATGNTIIAKLSVNTPEVAKVVRKILSIFPDKYVYVTKEDEREEIFSGKYDLCFYTGSTAVAKELMQKQAKNLTPCVLELGGKSPCIIDEDADIATAAKRVTWGKFLNAGQTCVAPDFVCVHKSVKEQFINEVKENITKFYYAEGKLSDNFTHIVNEKQSKQLLTYIKNENVLVGGKANGKCFEPTVLADISFNSPVMQQEIFGPILPIITFEDMGKLLDKFKHIERPLAFYYFGSKNAERCIAECNFGGGCVNDTIMHLTEENLPFGGIGFSGMGSYHGKKSFDTFTHYKSVLIKGKTELPLRYPPYTAKKLNFIKRFFKINK